MVKKQTLFIIGIVLFVFFLVAFGFLKTGTVFIYDLVFNKNIELKTEENGRINVLLLGIGGEKHDGPNLTDTIILASLNQKDNAVRMISIPRDLWILDLQAKINSAYSTGKEKNGKGLLLAKAAVQKITGVPIDYVVVIDFSGFVKLVDFLGGIDVSVKKTLDDFEYPIEGKENDFCQKPEEELPLLATAASQLEAFPCRYMHIHFDKGEQKMNGQEALRFARSRHARGEEGSDFARSTRQQLIISAIKQKVLSLGIILNPVKVIGIYSILSENINTNIQSKEFDDFVKLSTKMKEAKIKSTVIDTGETKDRPYGLLVNPPISDKQKLQWILIPRVGDGDFSEIKTFTECFFSGKECGVAKNDVLQK